MPPRTFADPEKGHKALALGYLAPTLNVRSIHVGDEGQNAANAIATEGFASFDIRLVPHQTPARVRALTEAYLTKQGWFIVHDTPDLATRLAHPKIAKVTWDTGESTAAKTPLDLPAARAVVASIARTVGYKPLELPTSGGSSGISEAVGALHTPMIGASIANYDTGVWPRAVRPSITKRAARIPIRSRRTEPRITGIVSALTRRLPAFRPSRRRTPRGG